MPITIETDHRGAQFWKGLQNRRKVNRKEKTRYQEYLESEEWKNLRIACLACHARNKRSFCFGCGRPRNPSQLRIHHLRYPGFGGVPLDPWIDLAPLCSRCHGEVHTFENKHLRREGISKNELRKELQSIFNAQKSLNRDAWNDDHTVGDRRTTLIRDARKIQKWFVKKQALVNFHNWQHFLKNQATPEMRRRSCELLKLLRGKYGVCRARR
jgi:hypothetical protein